VPLPGDDRPGRSRRGTLEEATSGAAVVAAAEQAGMRGRLTAKRVFDAARAGDPQALAAVASEADRIALLVATLSAVVDPELVVLGGGVGSNLDLLNPRLEERLRELTPLETQVVQSELGQDAIVLGAVASALGTARELVFAERVG
jgi:predicted NBD/HSP70 family sugar kinase